MEAVADVDFRDMSKLLAADIGFRQTNERFRGVLRLVLITMTSKLVVCFVEHELGRSRGNHVDDDTHRARAPPSSCISLLRSCSNLFTGLHLRR